jgi:hypothetical protein
MSILLLAVPFITSAIMFAIKWLAGFYAVGNGPDAKPVLRSLLLVLSLIGVLTTSIVNGTPVDPNTVSDLVTALLATLGTAYFAHAFYNSAFKR